MSEFQSNISGTSPALLQHTYLPIGPQHTPSVNNLIKEHNLMLAEKRLGELAAKDVNDTRSLLHTRTYSFDDLTLLSRTQENETNLEDSAPWLVPTFSFDKSNSAMF